MFLFVYLLFFNHFSTCNINNVRCNVHTAGNVMTSLNFLLQFWLGIQGFLWFTFLLICLCYTTKAKKTTKKIMFHTLSKEIKYFSKIFINEKLELENAFWPGLSLIPSSLRCRHRRWRIFIHQSSKPARHTA